MFFIYAFLSLSELLIHYNGIMSYLWLDRLAVEPELVTTLDSMQSIGKKLNLFAVPEYLTRIREKGLDITANFFTWLRFDLIK